MKSIKIGIIYAIIFLCSCSDNKNVLVFNSVSQSDVECFPIPYPPILGNSMQLLKKDSLLLINNAQGDSLIHVLDFKNNIVHNKLVSKGAGPNEVISPLAISMTDDNLYLYDRQTFRLFSFPIDMMLSEGKDIKRLFTLNVSASMLFPLSDSMFVASGFHDEVKRFTIYNNKGEKMSEFGDYPDYWYGEADLPNKIRGLLHQTFFEKHPSKKMLVAYSGHVLGIYGYETANKEPFLIKEVLLGKYSFKSDGNNANVTASPRMDEGVERGIISVACSSNYIYIAYNPNKKGEDNLSYQIRIIDWYGNPIKLLNIDKKIKKITCLTIDETETKGYIIAQNPEDTIMYFDLDVD